MIDILRDCFLSMNMSGTFFSQRSCAVWSHGFKQVRIYGISSNLKRSLNSGREESNEKFIVSHILNSRSSALKIRFILQTSKSACPFPEEIIASANRR